MADIVAHRTMFERLGFIPDAAIQLSGDAGEGLNSLVRLKALNDDRVRAVCKAVRRPGGAANGHAVSERAEHNLLICAFVVSLWTRTSRDSMTVADLVITPETLFTRAERQKELEKAWDNAEHTAMFVPLKSADLEKRFADLYEAFVDSLQNIRGVTGLPLKYLTRTRLIPKAEADDPANAYATVDEEMINRARIILPAHEADDDLENSGNEKRTEWAKVDNIRLFELLTIVFGETFAWVHAKGSKKSRNGRLALRSIWDNYNGPHALDARHAKILKDIGETLYHGEKRAGGWSKYVARHKELHLASSVLAVQGYNDFTGREKVSYLIDGIRTNDLEVPVGLINMNIDYRSNFEAAQRQIAEHIRLRRDRDRGGRNASAVSVDSGRGRGRGSGRGDAGRGGRGGRGDGGSRGDGGRWNNPITDADAMKCHWIDKTWYPETAYIKFNGLEKRKLFINQEEQRKREGKPLKARNTAPVREVSEMSTVISQLTASVASVASVAKETAKSLNRMKRTTNYDSDDESLLGSEDDDVAYNRSNAALARQAEKRKGRDNDKRRKK